MGIVSLLLDLIFIGLLTAVLIYAYRLNRNVAILQKSKEELEKLFRDFANSTERAESAIVNIKTATTENAAEIDRLLTKAETLRGDLGYMVDRGDQIAERLERAITDGRNEMIARQDRREDDRSLRADQTSGASGKSELRSKLAEKLKGGKAGSAKSAIAKEDGNESAPDEDGNAAGKKGKKKSDLLKALQGMR